jgi:4-amino-4-deoxy-L-arabinose transferase-like glycosyltransferase
MPTDWVLLCVLAASLWMRLHLATTKPYLPDEVERSFKLANSISWSPELVNLPIRGVDHPALPSYFVKLSRSLFGWSPLGQRLVHILTGLLTLLVVFRIADEWSGVVAARWAAGLLAFNEYHIGVSSYATAKGPFLFFVALALYAFTRFLTGERRSSLYLAAGFTGVAFYAKEHAALLLPVFLLTLAQARYRRRLRWTGFLTTALVFFVVISPDLIWNMRAAPDGDHATYGDHLARIGGLGFTRHYFLFFARDAIQALNVWLTGEPEIDTVAENPSMNSVLGLVLVASVVVHTFRRRRGDPISAFLLVTFWAILGFFVLIRPGDTSVERDPLAWYWVDAVLFPAVIVAGHVLATTTGSMRILAWSVASGAIAYAVWWTTLAGFTFGQP